MQTIHHHENTFELIALADAAYNRGEVETPLDYIDDHINEYSLPEFLYTDIQRIFESRAHRCY